MGDGLLSRRIDRAGNIIQVPNQIASVVSVNRRSRLDRGSRTKETERVKRGIVAQLEERLLHTQEVIGSRPVGPIYRLSIS